MGKRKTMDLNKIQSALQSLKEERAQIEKYLQNAATKKKELVKFIDAKRDLPHF